MSRGGGTPPYRPQGGLAQTEAVFAQANAAGVREAAVVLRGVLASQGFAFAMPQKLYAANRGPGI